MYFHIIVDIISTFGYIIELIGLALVIGSVFIGLFKLPLKEYTMEDVRKELARKIIFGLEFIIAADIILVTVATDMNQIIRLGGIVVIRVLLGYALRKEIDLK